MAGGAREMTLFDGSLEEWKALHPSTAGLSADARRTLRNRQMIERGRHPVTNAPLLDPGWNRTCGDCDHHFSHTRNQTWHKCELNATHGPATDIRVGWPACAKFRES